MNLEWILATRFLLNTHQSRSLSLFSLISILGIAFSVTLFLLVDTVMNGFSNHLSETLLGFEAPLVLESSASDMSKTQEEIGTFQKDFSNYHIKPVITRQFDGLLQGPEKSPSGVKARSVNEDFFAIKKQQLKIYWQEGFDQESFLKGKNLILVGESLYERLHFLPGDVETVTVTHPFADLGPTGEIEPHEDEFQIAGIFSTGYFEYDSLYILMTDDSILSLAEPQMLRNQVFLFPSATADINQIESDWRNHFPLSKASLQTWLEKNQNLFRAMELERIVFTLLFLIIVLISCFNLAGVVTIFGLSKAQDAAILKTLGLSVSTLRSILIRLAILLSSIGSCLGILLTLGVVFVFKKSNLLVSDAYQLSELSLQLNPKTLFALIFVTPILAALIAYWPAKKIAQKDIIEVMRLT